MGSAMLTSGRTSMPTLCCLVAPSWLLCLPFNKCGSPSRNMTNLAQELSTGNASKMLFFVLRYYTAKEQSYLTKNSKCGFLFLQIHKINYHCWLNILVFLTSAKF